MTTAKPRDDTTQEVKTISEERAKPHARPVKLAEDTEKKLREIDRKSAECYSSMEMLSHKFRRLAEELDED